MSRITEKDIELMNYWEAEVVNKEWFEFNEDEDDRAFCSKCKKEINEQDYNFEWARCPHCKAFLC